MLEKQLTPKRIRGWAGAASWSRGERYCAEDRVNGLRVHKDRITATVQGAHPYRVALWEDEEGFGFRCDCPVGLDGDFCKHCVATALASRQQPAAREAGPVANDLRAWLLLQTKESLADMLTEASAENESLGNRLTLRAAAVQGVNLATYRNVIAQAIGPDEFIDYRGMYSYWRRADEAIDAIADLLDQGHPAAVIELSEYALRKVERGIESVDDSDGYMSMLLDRLQELHLKACRGARPDAKALAERLFRWELNGEWDVFYGAAETYAKVLGKRGLAQYRELAEAEWDKIKPLEPGESDHGKYGKRFRITHIMETLAEQGGDIETLIAVKRRDLSSSYDFLRIAEIYKKNRQTAKAQEWAEQGIAAFGDKADSRLNDFLADLYHRRKRHDEAMALIWPQFEAYPTLGHYQKLKQHANRNKTWSEWRARALAHVRELLAKEAKNERRGRWHYQPWPDRSLLVEIFLWEKTPQQAWNEAQTGGCSRDLWLALASAREQAHPHDAIAVYRRLVGATVEQTNNEAYAEAVRLLRRIEKLMQRLSKSEAFADYVADLRVEYKRKRNFIKLLSPIG
jgi:uncharacterized Zn finger protein